MRYFVYKVQCIVGLFLPCDEPGSIALLLGCWEGSTSWNLSSLVMPSVCLRCSSVRFVSAFCLLSKSLRIFLFLCIRRWESCYLCFSCSFLSRWIRFKRAASASCCLCLSLASFFWTTVFIYFYKLVLKPDEFVILPQLRVCSFRTPPTSQPSS